MKAFLTKALFHILYRFTAKFINICIIISYAPRLRQYRGSTSYFTKKVKKVLDFFYKTSIMNS